MYRYWYQNWGTESGGTGTGSWTGRQSLAVPGLGDRVWRCRNRYQDFGSSGTGIPVPQEVLDVFCTTLHYNYTTL